MAAIKITGFIGEQPRIIPRLMPETAAQSAVNTRLDDGGLTPMRRAALIDTGDADWQTIYRHQGEWLGWEDIVNVAPGPVAQDRLYVTGDGVPKLIVGEDEYDLEPGDSVYYLSTTPHKVGAKDEKATILAVVYSGE